jgi:hypothetical protein
MVRERRAQRLVERDDPRVDVALDVRRSPAEFLHCPHSVDIHLAVHREDRQVETHRRTVALLYRTSVADIRVG